MALTALSNKDKFLLNLEGQDFSHEAKSFIKLRELASERLKELDFPAPKNENWKYTPTWEIAKGEFKPLTQVNITASDIQKLLVKGLDAIVLVFVNGFYQPKLSVLPERYQDGVTLCNINAAKKSHLALIEPYFGTIAKDCEHFFLHINNAFSQDGGFVFVEPNVVVENPIHFLFITDGDGVCAQPRNLIVAGKNSQVKVVFSFETLHSANAFTNAVAEVVVMEGAHVSLDKIQNENSETYHVSFDQAQQAKNSVFSINTFPLNGKLTRNNLNIVLDGKNAEANLNGLVCIGDKKHVDNQTFVDHAKAECISNELYKSIVDNQATNVFNGKIMVRKDAQKTNAYQSNANVLLSDEAKVNAKPQLEIFADDVKCSHGCTIGQFDKEALFYLQSRGIKKATAQKVLLNAFAGEVLDKISLEPVKEHVLQLIDKNFKPQ